MRCEIGASKDAELWGFFKGATVMGLCVLSALVRLGFAIVFVFVAVALTWDMLYSWVRVRER